MHNFLQNFEGDRTTLSFNSIYQFQRVLLNTEDLLIFADITMSEKNGSSVNHDALKMQHYSLSFLQA